MATGGDHVRQGRPASKPTGVVTGAKHSPRNARSNLKSGGTWRSRPEKWSTAAGFGDRHFLDDQRLAEEVECLG